MASALLWLVLLTAFAIVKAQNTTNNSVANMDSPHAMSQPAKLFYHGGGVLSNSFLYVVFWGNDWLNSSKLVQRIYAGLQTVVGGGYFDGLDEYGYGSLTLVGYTINQATMVHNQLIKSEEFINFASALISAGTIPKYHSQVLFILPTRHDVRADIPNGRFEVGGFHFPSYPSMDQKSGVGLSVVQTGSLIEDILLVETTFTAIMQAATHEVAESITDPYLDGWYGSDYQHENADICGLKTQLLRPSVNGVPVAYYWSDFKGDCTYQGGNDLQPVALSISGVPVSQCITVKWSTSLQAFEQPACAAMQWYVRGVVGTTIEVNPKIFNIEAGTRYLLISENNTWTVTSPASIPVNYVEQFFLSASSQYGSVAGEGWYNSNSIAYASLDTTIVDRAPNSRVRFLQWTGDASGSQFPVPVVMDHPRQVSASWTAQYYVSVTTPLATAQGSGWYDEGTYANLSLDQTLVSGQPLIRYRFSGWSGSTSGQATPLTVYVDGPKSIQASWTTQFYLNVLTNPEGLLQLQSEGWYDEGSSIILTAESQVQEHVFLNWSVDGTTLAGRTITVAMDRQHEAVANYVIPSIVVNVANPRIDITVGQQEGVVVSVEPASHQRVLIEYSNDTLGWTTLAQGVTYDNGTFIGSFTPSSTGVWYLRATILNTEGKPIVTSQTTPFMSVSESKTVANHVVINEFEQNPPGGARQFVELFNPTSQSVDMSNWIIYTTHEDIESYIIPAGAVLPARGFWQVTFPGHFMDNEDSLVLLNPQGEKVDETPTLSDTVGDSRSWQRYPDGSTDWVFAPSTLGAINVPEYPFPAILLALLIILTLLILHRQNRRIH